MTRVIRWEAMALLLVGAAALELLGGVASAFSLNDMPGRFRIEQFGRVAASPITGMLLLGAVLALMYAAGKRTERAGTRPMFFAAFVVSVLVMVSALVSAVNLATFQTDAQGPVVTSTPDWNSRLGFLLPRVAVGAIAFLAAYFANRYAPTREQPA